MKFRFLDITPLLEEFREWKAKHQGRATRTELVNALKKLYDRHSWQPGFGSCICEPHRNAEKILEKEKL